MKNAKSKHTPLPWESSPSGNIFGDIDNPEHDGDSPLVCQIFKGSFEPQKSAPLTERQKADMDLIVAAINSISPPPSTPGKAELIELLKDTLQCEAENAKEWDDAESLAQAIYKTIQPYLRD